MLTGVPDPFCAWNTMQIWPLCMLGLCLGLQLVLSNHFKLLVMPTSCQDFHDLSAVRTPRRSGCFACCCIFSWACNLRWTILPVCFTGSTHFCCSAQVFLTHLHSDHHADLATLYAGAMFGRTEPWEVWGPSSEKPELGLNASIAGLRQV